MHIFAIQFNGNIDLGQLIIAILVAALSFVGRLIKKEVTTVNERLAKHDLVITRLSNTVQRLLGYYYGTKGMPPIDEESKGDITLT